MPPGPPTKPIIGNMLDMSLRRLHKTFHEWAKQYGDVFSVKVLGRTVIVISSSTISKEVLDRHANASGNRPNSAIIQMVVPDGLNLGLACHADDLWKAMRRASTQLLNNENMRKMIPYQRAEATQLMWEFANQPDV
ncbi:cytochrome P450 [Amanita rubescens]|nr:cytochrome P450 [Amanita rubescens]